MAKCICCGKEIDEKTEKYYGVIQKHHFNNITTTADIDTGPTWFKPVALIRIGVCRECNRSLGTEKIGRGAKMLFGGIAVTVIGVLIAMHSDSEYIGAVALLGLALFGFGLFDVIRGAAAKLASTESPRMMFAMEASCAPSVIRYGSSHLPQPLVRLESFWLMRSSCLFVASLNGT